MDFINNFLQNQADEGVFLYNLMGTIGHVLLVAAVIFYLVRMRPKFLDLLKGLLFAFIAYEFMFPAQFFAVWYRNGFDPSQFYSHPANIALGYTLLPLLAWLMAKTFNTSTGYAGDIVGLTAFSFHVAGRSGCLFTGCCYGFACDWGWYSHSAIDDAVHNAINNDLALPGADYVYKQFPTSLVESLFTLAIVIFVIVRICRKNYVPDGKNLPYFLFFYGICRFFSELTRESTKETWFLWRFSDVHVHMLIMALVGGFMLYYITKKEKMANQPVGPTLPELKGQRR